MSALLVLGDSLLEVAELIAAAAELLCHRCHGRCHVFSRLIDMGSQRASVGRDLTQLASEERFADTRIAVDVEEEPTPFVVNGEAKVLLVLDHLSLPAGKSALLTSADAILQRTRFPGHVSLQTRLIALPVLQPITTLRKL
jgi:hypothetical protein